MRLTDKAVLSKLASLKQPVNIETLAAMLDCSPSTVKRSIHRLSEKEMIRKLGGGRRKPRRYAINHDALPDDVKQELAHANQRNTSAA